jgi:hypothetical protein
MKDLRCVLGFHRYGQHRIEGGSGTYLACRRCGKTDDSFVPTGDGVIKVIGFIGFSPPTRR